MHVGMRQRHNHKTQTADGLTASAVQGMTTSTAQQAQHSAHVTVHQGSPFDRKGRACLVL